ncbi:hypothetical protein WK77_16725 [Burkholderia ubonensis]|nr:hypothetical protein WK77_16725 [Burkholderia ubonensis]
MAMRGRHRQKRRGDNASNALTDEIADRLRSGWYGSSTDCSRTRSADQLLLWRLRRSWCRVRLISD